MTPHALSLDQRILLVASVLILALVLWWLWQMILEFLPKKG